jgi:hypothetical protein
MNRHFFTAIFAVGAMALMWVAAGFFGTNLLALMVTLLISAVYGFGALELHRFRQSTSGLSAALSAIPEGLSDLNDWLVSVPASLQNPVRLRVEGERVGLPGPALTPYLVGLLVMLGMLGTFLGMVVTLKGAVFALEGTSDLAAIRSAFATPIKGLGLAFGTSVAGVASSAVLGLLSALSRRERMQAAQLLDSKIATQLSIFSHSYQRQETFKALQLQSQALPLIADKMQAMMLQMERVGQQMNERLLSNQESFHSSVNSVYTDLARSVDQSLRSSLSQSMQIAGESIKPVVESAMTGIADEARLMHERMIAGGGQSLEHMAARMHSEWQQISAQMLAQQQQTFSTLKQTAEQLTDSTQISASKTVGEISKLMASSEELVRARIATEADWTAQHGQRLEQLSAMLRTELGALRAEETVRGNAAVDRLAELQTALTSHLTTLGIALEDPITRLIETASEAPRAAAEVIGQLRQEISHSVARDNALLEERSRIMETLNTLLEGINHASLEQRAVIDSLVASSAVSLERAGEQFAEKVDVEAAKLADIAAHVTSSSVEVASLGETFNFAVRSFNAGNEKLIANLQRIEGAMDKSMARSDDQLAYYVAQAREVIDLSITSQKEIVEELRQLADKRAMLVPEAA